jgi:hypothetical protein
VGTSANIGLPLPQRIYHNVTGQEAVATASQPEPAQLKSHIHGRARQRGHSCSWMFHRRHRRALSNPASISRGLRFEYRLETDCNEATAVLGCFTGVTDERLAILLLFQEVPGSNIDWRQTVMKPQLSWMFHRRHRRALSNPASISRGPRLEYRLETGCNEARAVLGCFTGVTDERLAILLLFQEVPGSNIDWRQTVMKPQLSWMFHRRHRRALGNPASISRGPRFEYRLETGCNEARAVLGCFTGVTDERLAILRLILGGPV